MGLELATSANPLLRSRSWGLRRKEPLQEGEHAQEQPARCLAPAGRNAQAQSGERARTEQELLRAQGGNRGPGYDLQPRPLQGADLAKRVEGSAFRWKSWQNCGRESRAGRSLQGIEELEGMLR